VPWTQNPILTQRDLDGTVPQAVTCTGHANLVEGPDGNWWAVFLACRPIKDGYQTTGRETFLLPMKWTADGWPLILPPGERVPYTVAAPKVAEASPAPVPLSGNFTWRDEFDSGAAKLAPLWLMLRTPKETWWSLTEPKGSLSLMPRAETLDGLGNPSFLGRRIQHAKFEASVALTVPTEPKVSAGLALVQNEKHLFYLAVRREGEGLALFLERADGGTPAVVVSKQLPAAALLELRFVADDLLGSFGYRTSGGAWQVLATGVDLKSVTVKAAGDGMHFTGAVVGPHARLEP
jgi:alpha-N-arabinofuranosidase